MQLCAGAIKKPASYAVIARPHEEIVKLVELSASAEEYRGKPMEEKAPEKTAEDPQLYRIKRRRRKVKQF